MPLVIKFRDKTISSFVKGNIAIFSIASFQFLAGAKEGGKKKKKNDAINDAQRCSCVMQYSDLKDKNHLWLPVGMHDKNIRCVCTRIPTVRA